MAKYQAKEDISIPFLGTIKANSVFENISTDSNKISFKTLSGSTVTIEKNDYISKLTGVPDNTPLNLMFDETKTMEIVEGGVKNFGKSVQMGAGIGTVAGLSFAFYRKSGISGYLGYAFIFGVIGGIVGGYFGGKKALKEVEKKS